MFNTDTPYMTIYLNNSGHRWITRDVNNKSDRVNVFNKNTGKIKSYAVNYWEAIGNFAVPYVKINGKREQLMNYNNHAWMINNGENRNWKYNGENPIAI